MGAPSRAPWLAALPLLVAGCLSATAPLNGAHEPAAPALFGYLCPGAATLPDSHPCLSWLERDDATLQEPYAAAHPGDPRIMAVGVNFGQPLAERVAGAPAGDSHTCRLAVYISEDMGASWRATMVPVPALGRTPLGESPAQCAGDPALLFDPEGRLHLTGIATDDLPLPLAADPLGTLDAVGYQTFYARSDDLGRTWSPPVVLSPNGQPQDRNWMDRDPSSGALYVNWQNTEGPQSAWSTEVAWSADGGATWRTQEPGGRAPCSSPGRVRVLGGEALFACSHTEGEAPSLRVYAFDPASGVARERAALPDAGTWPFLVPGPAGLVMAYERATDVLLRASPDGGRAWTEPQSLLGTVGGGWHRASLFWAEPGPHGSLHLLVRLGRADVGDAWQGPAAYELRHLVLDGQGAVAQDTLLVAWRSPSAPTPRAAAPLGNDFFGIAWSQDRALLAFSRDAAVAVTVLAPAGAPAGGAARLP